MRRRLLSLWLVAAGGCWTEEPLVHDAFTADQWTHLQKQYKPPEKPDTCELPPVAQGSHIDCDLAAGLGQQLFFTPALSGPWITDSTGRHPAAQVSCATCHDTVKSGWFVDTRPDSAVSMGAEKPTMHNTVSVVNVAVGYREIYTWSGQCKDPATMKMLPCQTTQNVVHNIALPNAMKSDAEIISLAIRNNPSYRASYQQAFRSDSLAARDIDIQQNVEVALDAYMRRLVSLDSPFDDFVRGDDDAIDASAKRGFAVFVGRGMCAECHGGNLFTDGAAHVTGVAATNDKDLGRGDTGAFYTPGLRHVAKTGPYMHNGTIRTLWEVIDFYRRGGHASGYFGTKDALMAPLDISDDDAKDLEAFLRTLTGDEVIDGLRRDTHLLAGPQLPPSTVCQVPNSSNQGLFCGGMCRDVANDPMNCGSCGHTCSSYCMAGMCGP